MSNNFNFDAPGFNGQIGHNVQKSKSKCKYNARDRQNSPRDGQSKARVAIVVAAHSAQHKRLHGAQSVVYLTQNQFVGAQHHSPRVGQVDYLAHQAHVSEQQQPVPDLQYEWRRTTKSTDKREQHEHEAATAAATTAAALCFQQQ